MKHAGPWGFSHDQLGTLAVLFGVGRVDPGIDALERGANFEIDEEPQSIFP